VRSQASTLFQSAHNQSANQLLIDIFGIRDSSGRISKSAVELSVHVVDLKKHSATKSQILVNFVTECCDEAWSVAGAGAVAILTSPLGVKLRYAARLQFNSKAEKCTNNIAEYDAIY
jgi:hypothetical protein